MQIQFTRKQIVNTFLIGTMALAIGSVHVHPAEAQLNRSAFLETARELDLSRSQMREVAGIMQGFKSEIEAILSPEQFQLFQFARTQQESQSQIPDPQKLQETLNLTDTQSAQLVVVREEMLAGLQEVLTPYQLEGMMEMTAFSQL